jgi:hypothetical protein
VLSAGGEPDEVGEEHRDDLALVARLVRLVIERSAAEVAIPGTCWVVLATARASRHGRSVRRWAPQSTGNSQAYSEAMPARSDPSRAPMTASAASRLSG